MAGEALIDDFFTSGEQKNLVALMVFSAVTYTVLKVTNICPGKELNVGYPIVSAYSTLRSSMVAVQAVADGTMMAMITSTESRLHAPHQGFVILAEITFAYELWNTMCALTISEYRTPGWFI
jgi:hypothetical protein